MRIITSPLTVLAALGPRLAIFAFVLVAYALGAFSFLDHAVQDARYRLMARAATGEVVVVAIDPLSLRRVGSWPWLRDLHATVIDRLVDADVASIAYAIDFSAPSTPMADERLAEALRRASGKVILSAFRQSDTTSEPGQIWKTLPLEDFQKYAKIASINVYPDRDGRVRDHTVWEPWPGQGRMYSLPAAMAGVGLQAPERFLIDYGIRPNTIPVIPIIDIATGRRSLDDLAGKRIIVGATAMELGDSFSVPVYQSLPGPVLLAMAYESIAQNRMISAASPYGVVVAVLLLTALFGGTFPQGSWRLGGGVALATVSGLFALSFVTHAMAVDVPVVPLMAVPVLSYLIALVRNLDQVKNSLILSTLAVDRQARTVQSIADNSFDGILLVEETGRILFANATAQRLFGYAHLSDMPIEHLIARKWLSPEPGAHTPDIKYAVGLRDGVGMRKGGLEFPLEMVVSPADVMAAPEQTADVDGEGRRFLLTVRDITERKHAEAQLYRANTELEYRVYERTRELQIAKEEAEIANAAKSTFMASMSHELRTPLNAILGFSEVMLMDENQHLSPQQKSYIGYIKRGGEHLLELVKQVLDINRIESGDISLDPEILSASALAQEAITMVMAKAAERRIEVINRAADDQPWAVWVDKIRLRQVLLNLLSNAVKYNEASGKVFVDFETTDDGKTRISVTDTGQGIPESRQSGLFQPFDRLGRESGEVEGAGIGLTICRRLAEMMGGRISFNSTEGVGSTFWIDVPSSDAAALRGAQLIRQGDGPSREGEGSGATQILYVEDNPGSVALMEKILARIPEVQVRVAETGEDGLKMAAESPPDLILMDIDLPGISGIEALRRLKASFRTRVVPVIAVTASALPRDIENGMNAGFDHYITKPISVEKTLGAIIEALEKNRQIRKTG